MALNQVSTCPIEERNTDMNSDGTYQGAKPKVLNRRENTSIGAQGDKENLEDSLQKWKEAGIALRKALAKVERLPQQATSERKSHTTDDMIPQSGDGVSSQFDNGPNLMGSYIPGNDMNSLLDQHKENGSDLSESSHHRHRQPLYKRTSSSMHRIHSDSQMCMDRTVGAQGHLGLVDLHKDSISSDICDSCLNSSATSTFHRRNSQGPCSNLVKHRHCHKSKLPVPVRRASLRDKGITAEKTETKAPGYSAKSRSIVCRRKSKSLVSSDTKIPAPCKHTSSSEDEFGPVDKPSGVVDSLPTAPVSSHLMAADSVANLADEELSSEQSEGDFLIDEKLKKVLYHATLALGDNRPENPLSILSSSEESLASILSSGDEVLVSAEHILATPPPQDSIEGQADEQDDDSLDLESDENLSFGDLAVSDESQAHEEPDNDIDQALFDLKVETSDEMDEDENKPAEEGGEVTCEDADDEYECECATCQYYDGLPDLMPRMGTGFGSDASTENDDDDNFFGDLDIGYRFRPQELDISMGVLLLQQGRTSFLELMFQNVILQMLAVYPDLLGEQAPPPLSPQKLQALPSINISQEQADENSPCPICLCVFTLDEEAKELPCHHVFHTLCIQAWLSKSGTCPVCRHKLQSSDGD